MAINKLNTLELVRISLLESKSANKKYNNKIKQISNINTPFVLQNYIFRQEIANRYKLRQSKGDFMVLLIVDFLGLESFKIKDINIGLYDPIKFSYAMPYLVEQGFFTKDKGTYTTTEKHKEFIYAFKDEYRSALKRFSSVERIGITRKGNRLDSE
jgi:hypothetical protein